MKKIKSILVPIDFSGYSKHALTHAVDFAEVFNSTIHLVYVVEPSVYPADFSMGQIPVPAMEVEATERSQKDLEDIAKSYIGEKVTFTTEIRSGRASSEIIDCAAEKDIDLIIIATHGHSGVEHLIFGSTAERVVRKAPCPVLTLRDPIKGFKVDE